MTLLATPYVMLGTLRQRSVSRNLRNFTQTKCKLPGAPTEVLWVKWPPFPIIPNRDSRSEFLNGNPGPTRMVAAISRKASIGAGVYHPSSGNTNLVEPNGAGITNTIGRAELPAIAAAITYNHTHIATDSLTSLHQIRKQLLCPEKHVIMSKETSSKFFLILSETLNPTSSFIK